MTSFTILWEKALRDLRDFYMQNNNMIGFDNYIKILKPEFEEEDTLYFSAEKEYQRDLVVQRFLPKIAKTLNETAFATTGVRKNYHIEVLMPSQIDLLIMQKKASPIKNRNASTLNPSYTFETFVVGNDNRLANAAARAVADTPGQTYNPLFIYGGVGLGKTHLLHAIGNHVAAQNPHAQVIYITSEAFRNEFIEAIRNESNEKFRNKFRNADVLLIDDVQFISKGTGTQEELFHTFNTLYEAQKQIVLSSDKHPSEIPKLEERLLSRFQWGLLADIGMPDFETRVAILKSKAPMIKALTKCDLDIDESVIHYIASKDATNIRDLEGALKKVIAHAKLESIGNPTLLIDLELAQNALHDFFNNTAKAITPKIIIKNVCEYFDITETDLLSGKRSKEIAYPRQITMYLMRYLLNLAFPKIGELLGGRHYSTVIFANDKISELSKTDHELKNILSNIIHRIKE